MRLTYARWSLEVSHRLRKQNLALGSCQCLSYAAHLQHAELVSRAFELMCQERQQTPDLSWKLAQQHAATTLRNALLYTKFGGATGGSRLAA